MDNVNSKDLTVTEDDEIGDPASSVVSDSSSLCADDFNFVDAVHIPNTDGLVVETEPVAVKLDDGSKGLSVSRSVLQVDYIPLWGFTSVCGRRPEMEDALATVPRLLRIPLHMLLPDCLLTTCLTHLTAHFFGIYDGHGGSQVANYCRDRIHAVLAEELVTMMANFTDASICQEQWKRVFTNSFLKVDDEVGGTGGNEPVARETVGSTAVVAVVCSSHIIVANCGDSRAVLCRGKEPMALSVDHKPNREDEYSRIEAAGGKVIQWNGHRVFGVLAMSRSIDNPRTYDYPVCNITVQRHFPSVPHHFIATVFLVGACCRMLLSNNIHVSSVFHQPHIAV